VQFPTHEIVVVFFQLQSYPLISDVCPVVVSTCILPLTPSERVARLLSQTDSHLGHAPHPLFTEMESLVYSKELKDYEWIEQAR
jgi:hypothetical protein